VAFANGPAAYRDRLQTHQQQRFRIYLTNCLEESHPDTGTLFANWLSTEANEANYIKRDTPVMVLVGNPPYLGESKNNGSWIQNLMKDYKQEPTGGKLKEKNSKPINNDYVKFFRYAQYFIEKTGEGVLAFITPNTYIDNSTFRGMRWNMLKTYNKVYVINLHGSNTNEGNASSVAADENVFDIKQGVSISIPIKTKKKIDNSLASIMYYDLVGKRDDKYDFYSKIHSLRFPLAMFNLKDRIIFFCRKSLKGMNTMNWVLK
jgi:predicted helicase